MGLTPRGQGARAALEGWTQGWQAAGQSVGRAQGQRPPDRRDRGLDARARAMQLTGTRRRDAGRGRQARRPVQHGRRRGRQLRLDPRAAALDRAHRRLLPRAHATGQLDRVARPRRFQTPGPGARAASHLGSPRSPLCPGSGSTTPVRFAASEPSAASSHDHELGPDRVRQSRRIAHASRRLRMARLGSARRRVAAREDAEDLMPSGTWAVAKRNQVRLREDAKLIAIRVLCHMQRSLSTHLKYDGTRGSSSCTVRQFRSRALRAASS